jgi:integrase
LKYSIEDIISKDTIIKYGNYLKDVAKIQEKNITPAHIHNYQSITIRFLNYVAEQLHLPKIEFFLRQPQYSSKWHIDEVDVQRLLAHKATTKTQVIVQDIIRINSLIGLRIGELLTTLKDNISVDNTRTMYIRFAEHKKSKERTIVIVDAEVISIIEKYMNNEGQYLWSFCGHNWFNVVLQDIAKEVFKDECIQIYKHTIQGQGYQNIKKSEAISSHAFRRFGIERNIVKFGMDVARTFSGHQDTAIMYKHYAGYMNAEDLKNKLLKS